MKNESRKYKVTRTLDERFAKHPETQEQLHRIADEMEQAITEGMTADEAEEMAIKRINELGRALLTDWAKARQERAVEEVRQEKPGVIGDVKKK